MRLLWLTAGNLSNFFSPGDSELRSWGAPGYTGGKLDRRTLAESWLRRTVERQRAQN